MYVLFFITQIAFPIFILYLILAFITGAPFVPSTDKTARTMIDLAHTKTGQTVIDLGSGDGRLLQLAAAQGAKAVGIEMNPYLVIFSKIRALLSPYRNKITVRWRNLWKTNLSQADVIFIYLLPWRMDTLAKKLKKECKPGTLVVSNSFLFPHWKILRQDSTNHVYVYKV